MHTFPLRTLRVPVRSCLPPRQWCPRVLAWTTGLGCPDFFHGPPALPEAGGRYLHVEIVTYTTVLLSSKYL